MSTADTRTVTADDGTRLHVTVDGPVGAGHTVVMAHGWTLSQRSWDPVVRALRLHAPPERIRVVAYDQRHHGRSGRGTSELSMDLLGDDLARLLAEVVPDGPVTLAGHSMGGMSIMALAAAHPELFASRITGVALVSTSAGGVAPPGNPPQRLLAGPVRTAALRHHRLVDTLRALTPPALPVHRHLVRRMVFGAHTAPEVVRTGAEMVQSCPARTVLEFWPALQAHDKTTALAPLGTVPVEILVGSHDRLTPVRRARFLAEHITSSRLTVLPGHGHMLTLERPELLARTVLSLATPAPTSAR